MSLSAAPDTRSHGEPCGVTHAVLIEAPAWDEAAPDLDALAARSLTAAWAVLPAPTPGELSIAFVDDARQAALNNAYRSRAGATNVLAFPAAAPPPGAAVEAGARMLGDIAIALETTLSEAHARAIPPPHHITHLIVHGFFHLQGYDHQTDDDAAIMENLERRALARLGIPDPYGPAADAPQPFSSVDAAGADASDAFGAAGPSGRRDHG